MSIDALEEAHAAYTARNPSPLEAYSSSCKFFPGGNTRTVLHALPFPLTFASGSASTLTFIDNDTYVDFLGEYTAGTYGHNNPTIRSAIDVALTQGWSFGGNNVYEKELARLVCLRFRPAMELVRFTNSGTEANMMAVATSLAWTGRKKILVFDKDYHGATLSFRSMPSNQSRGTVNNVNLPHDWVMGTYNNVEKTEESSQPFHSRAWLLYLLNRCWAVAAPSPALRPSYNSYDPTRARTVLFLYLMRS